MEFRGYLVIAALCAVLFLGRKDALRDGGGNATARPVAWSWACLIVAAFFFLELLSKVDDPFYRRHPENFYVLWAFIAGSFLCALFMRFSHVTLAGGMLIEHLPPFWHREIRLSELAEVDDAGPAFVFRALDKRKVGLPKAYAGANGLVDGIRRARPDLFRS